VCGIMIRSVAEKSMAEHLGQLTISCTRDVGPTQLALYCAGVLRTGKWKYWHLALGMPLKSSFLREYSSEYLTEYSSTR